MTIIINFIGAPSSGKSLMSALLFAEMKLNHNIIEYVQEYIKHLVWNQDFDKINDQLHISTEQYKLFKNINGKVDYIVTDGSLIHCLFYNKYNKGNTSNTEYTEHKTKEYINEFKNIFIFLKRGDFPYETEGRIHTVEESTFIENELENLLKSLNLEYITLTSSKESVISAIKYINSFKI